jgi:hypothetical protein
MTFYITPDKAAPLNLNWRVTYQQTFMYFSLRRGIVRAARAYDNTADAQPVNAA